MKRKFNFYAGPAVIPFPVLEQIEKEMNGYLPNSVLLNLTIVPSHRASRIFFQFWYLEKIEC